MQLREQLRKEFPKLTTTAQSKPDPTQPKSDLVPKKLCMICDYIGHDTTECKLKNSPLSCTVCYCKGHTSDRCSMLQNPLFFQVMKCRTFMRPPVLPQPPPAHLVMGPRPPLPNSFFTQTLGSGPSLYQPPPQPQLNPTYWPSLPQPLPHIAGNFLTRVPGAYAPGR